MSPVRVETPSLLKSVRAHRWMALVAALGFTWSTLLSAQEVAPPLEAPPGEELRSLSTGDAPWIELGPNDAVPWSDSEHPWLPRLLPPSNGRHRGLGQPLEGESWLNRPFSASLFGGALVGDQPLKNRVDGSTGYLTGMRFGWDVDHFWGVETRLAFSNFGLDDVQQPARRMGDAKVFHLDASYLWYPWGDARWRPYATLGMGLGDYSFFDENDQKSHQTAFTMPFGGGVKVRATPRWVFRFDVLDNLVFDQGSQLDTMHNLSITAGLEARWGVGPRKSYYPWNPGRR